jgi:hypothetical protein
MRCIINYDCNDNNYNISSPEASPKEQGNKIQNKRNFATLSCIFIVSLTIVIAGLDREYQCRDVQGKAHQWANKSTNHHQYNREDQVLRSLFT